MKLCSVFINKTTYLSIMFCESCVEGKMLYPSIILTQKDVGVVQLLFVSFRFFPSLFSNFVCTLKVRNQFNKTINLAQLWETRGKSPGQNVLQLPWQESEIKSVRWMKEQKGG